MEGFSPEIINSISNLGFPIFVAVYMLVKNSQETARQAEAFSQLTTAVNKLVEKLDCK